MLRVVIINNMASAHISDGEIDEITVKEIIT
jgi:hypothetical protein